MRSTLTLSLTAPSSCQGKGKGKAFDTVSHRQQLAKLSGYGIGGETTEMDRSLPGGTSTTSHRQWQQIIMDPRVTSGIPQGSVLGPLLFVCYVNDMPENLTSMAYMYADYTKVYRNNRTHIDREVLQSDLRRLEDWSRKWQLRCNAGKCKVLHIGRQNLQYEYYMDRGTKIGVTTNKRDLGVQIHPDLKFNQHVETVTSKANRMLGMIRRAYTNRMSGMIRRAYTNRMLGMIRRAYTNRMLGMIRRAYTNRMLGMIRRAYTNKMLGMIRRTRTRTD